MSNIPDDLKYTEDHEWVRMDEGTASCGITDHAQEMLNDIVFVELPEQGREVKKKDQVAVIESVKAVSDVYAPVAGKIVEVNSKLEEMPELINSDPYGEGWIFRIEADDEGDMPNLIDSKVYDELVQKEEEEDQ